MGDNNFMIKLCIFDTFEECKEAEHYDHNYQKAVALSTVSGVDLTIIRDNNLHIQDSEGNYYLDQYLKNSSIIPLFQNEYEEAKKYWSSTRFWSYKYKFGDKFVYCKDHSDRSYNIIEVDDMSSLILLDTEGNEITEE